MLQLVNWDHIQCHGFSACLGCGPGSILIAGWALKAGALGIGGGGGGAGPFDGSSGGGGGGGGRWW